MTSFYGGEGARWLPFMVGEERDSSDASFYGRMERVGFLLRQALQQHPQELELWKRLTNGAADTSGNHVPLVKTLVVGSKDLQACGGAYFGAVL